MSGINGTKLRAEPQFEKVKVNTTTVFIIKTAANLEYSIELLRRNHLRFMTDQEVKELDQNLDSKELNDQVRDGGFYFDVKSLHESGELDKALKAGIHRISNNKGMFVFLPNGNTAVSLVVGVKADEAATPRIEADDASEIGEVTITGITVEQFDALLSDASNETAGREDLPKTRALLKTLELLRALRKN